LQLALGLLRSLLVLVRVASIVSRYVTGHSYGAVVTGRDRLVRERAATALSLTLDAESTGNPRKLDATHLACAGDES